MRNILRCSGFLLVVVVVTTLILPNHALAQEPGTWQFMAYPSQNVNILLTTPYALYAGQFSLQGSPGPYNGLYKSQNLGATWNKSGLGGRGVADLAYTNGITYTATYYQVDGTVGLFTSQNHGLTWEHLGPNYPCLQVAVTNNSVIIGTKYNGIWTSSNGGDFIQTLVIAGTTKDVLGLECLGNVCLASTYMKAYKSTDNGLTWQELPSLEGKAVSNFSRYKEVVLAGTKYGLYRSTDGGTNWDLYAPWGTAQIGNVIFYDKTAYIAKRESNGSYQVYRSNDLGLSWESTNMDNPANTSPLSGLVWLYAKPAYLFAAGFAFGIQRYAISPEVPPTYSFLGPLWEDSTADNQLQSITSYFDHSYPLLAYPYSNEPQAESTTTTNFWGDREKIPQLYYSSHDGVDFGLNYGTPLLAPFAGSASYSYTLGGGNTIKIDHGNGYQTIYLHLQKTGLVTNQSTPVWIDKGVQVGLVGMTGNTTGPHLHFAVRKDINGNGSFEDDAPDGRVDPYAWLNSVQEDPWEIYSWTDALGQHTGSQSLYLWEEYLIENSVYIPPQGGEVTGENVHVTVPEGASDKSFTLTIQKSMQNNVAFAGAALKYVEKTVTRITGTDHMGQTLVYLTNPAQITFDLAYADLTNVLPESLKVYYFDPISTSWQEIASVWNEVEKKLTGVTTHFSEFAVFGQKSDPNAPITTITFTGQKDGKWYIESPTVILTAVDGGDGSGVDKTFYSIDGGDEWEEYLAQTQVEKEGVYAILFRSSDLAGNYEETKESQLLRVDTLNRFKGEVVLENASFTVSY